nr:MAG TPA: hypothetical protein [Caudoviricetes sp.]
MTPTVQLYHKISKKENPLSQGGLSSFQRGSILPRTIGGLMLN